MENKQKNYIFLILIHVAIGFVIYLLPFMSKIYGYGILLGGIYLVVKTRNSNNQVLYVAAYIIGSEVFLRMTDGNPNYEFAKYSVMLFAVMGMFYSGFSKNAIPYWIFLLLLIPSVVIATAVLNDTNTDIRKMIAFNISGSVCLGIASIYAYNKKISIEAMNNILLVMGLPIISCAVYLLFYTPNIKDVLTGTGSSYELSGGFGPNQVATVLGLGMFVFFSRLILASKTKLLFSVNLIIAVYISYRGMLTFSRGGMVTGFAMIIAFLLFVYFNSKYQGKIKLNFMIVFLFISMASIWMVTSYQTGGLIDKRYANKDALGRVKKDKFSGREQIAETEINMFLENPVFGVGVAKGTEIRSKEIGSLTTSHDEITRMLAEHGTFGILALLILILTPLILYIDNKQHIYLFSCLIFWFLTINHAAMRTAAPAFIYALTLLKVKFKDETMSVVDRE